MGEILGWVKERWVKVVPADQTAWGFSTKQEELMGAVGRGIVGFGPFKLVLGLGRWR